MSSHRETTNPLKEGQGGHGCVWGGEGAVQGRGVGGRGKGVPVGLELPPQPELESPSAHGLVSLTRARDSGARGFSSCLLLAPTA